MNTFISYFDCFSFVDDPLFHPLSEEVEAAGAPSQTDLSEPEAFDLEMLTEIGESEPVEHEAWSFRNDEAGVGLVMNTEATDWQDMVWVDWD